MNYDDEGDDNNNTFTNAYGGARLVAVDDPLSNPDSRRTKSRDNLSLLRRGDTNAVGGGGGSGGVQGLIRINDDDDERMTSDQSYGAIERRSREPTADQPALDAAGVGGYRRPRQLSFKKRSTTNDSSTGGPAGFLNRASIAAFGRPFAGSSSSSSNAAAGSNREPRRVHTISYNGQQARQTAGGDGGGSDEHGEDGLEGGGGSSSWERKPRIPSLMPAAPSSNSTPIPTVPFVVLCLVCFGEFSSAGVAGPFLFFQIESFNVGGEGEVGYWAGVVASVFFFAQFLTSLLWASAAQQHGRRAVLLVSLLGNALTLVAFGMSTNLKMAISVRLAQGLFNGAVGVAKGAVRDLTDNTNEGRAMAMLGFAWGMGGIVGPLMGGLLCNPATKFPSLFGQNDFLIRYPYALPCIIVSSFMAIGACLTLFIGPDGGPRTGAIRLPEKYDSANRTTSAVGSFGRTAGKRISGYFGAATPDGQPRTPAGESLVDLRAAGAGDHAAAGLPRTFTQIVDEETGGPPSPRMSDVAGESDEEDANGTAITTTRAGTSAYDDGFRRPYFARPRRMSRTTARHRSILGGGSAYGYTDVQSSSQRPGSSVANNRTSIIQHPPNRMSIMSSNQYAPDFEEIGTGTRFSAKPRQLSFAQRFLLANDDAVLGLSDLWVAAAINNDEGYGEDADGAHDEDDVFGYGYGDDGRILEDETATMEESMDESVFDRSDAPDSNASLAFGHGEPDEDSPLMPRHLPPVNFARRHRQSSAGASSRGLRPLMNRVGSAGRIPSVYSNTGVENTPMLNAANAAAERPMSPAQGRTDNAVGGYDPTLAGIPESGSMPGTLRGASGKLPDDDDGQQHLQYGGGVNASHITAHLNAAEKQSRSLFRQLPLGFIAHYGLMSLHSSTFDQVFMAYLVTPFKSGGLGLTAAHYAELIAAMAFCQIGLQFYFYPKVGPPQGKFSHLAMMRIGTCLYLPVYVLFSYLRSFLHPSTDILVMSFMILFASLRFLANTCAFTSVAILMNATTEPHLVPLANGLAQTTSSAARFIGPLLGGMLWARGVEGGYELHSWPFNYQMGFWFVGLLGFSGFLHTWLIR